MKDLLTTRQVAERLGVSASRVRQFIIDGRLPAIKLGRDNLIREVDLRLVEDRKAGRPTKPKKAPTKKTTASRDYKKR